MRSKSRGFDYLLLTLLIIGAINWGLIGFFRFDLVAALFGEASMLSRIIYALIGIAGLCAVSLFARMDNRIDNVDLRYENNHREEL